MRSLEARDAGRLQAMRGRLHASARPSTPDSLSGAACQSVRPARRVAAAPRPGAPRIRRAFRASARAALACHVQTAVSSSETREDAAMEMFLMILS